MPEVRDWSIEKIVVPDPPVIVLRTPVFLAHLVAPHFVPAGLVPGVPLFQFLLDGSHQFASELPLAVIIPGEVVIGVLAGDAANGSSTPKKKSVLLIQDGPPGDVDRA